MAEALDASRMVKAGYHVDQMAGHRLSLRAYADRRTALRAVIPFAVLSFDFAVLSIVLLQQPMGMRHGM